MNVNIKDLTDSRDTVNKWMERFGVRFGVYKKGIFREQLFPFDSVPRIISKSDWDYLEHGLQQRVKALNMFLWDIYHDKRIIKNGIVPEEFVYSSKGYMPECEGISPEGKVYACSLSTTSHWPSNMPSSSEYSKRRNEYKTSQNNTINVTNEKIPQSRDFFVR